VSTPTTSGTRKQFDPDLYAEHDAAARDAVRSYLLSRGLYVTDNDDKYGPDICVYVGFSLAYHIEVEVKRTWAAGTDFTYPNLQIPGRKGKLLTYSRKPIEFWVLRADLQQALVVTGWTLADTPLVEVPNKLVPEGEQFYSVPLEECILLDLLGPPGPPDTTDTPEEVP